MDEEPQLRELSLAARLPVALAALALAGCFTPVIEAHPHPVHKDGGSDGGTHDGGFTDGGCVTFQDCHPSDAGLCGAAGSPSPSCISGTCLSECPGGRTCTVSDPSVVKNDGGFCLTCGADGGMRSCSAKSCVPGPHCTLRILASNCPGLPLDAGFMVTTRADCQQIVPGLGEWVTLSSSEAIANFSSLGGTCLGVDLFTALPRMTFSCPQCQFVTEGCE